ncbi:MAG: J domain-containing protein [Actinomycetota bacterium]|nr:J domain-containing protein [Actinomycetota bacterium]
MRRSITFKDIDKARKILGLPDVSNIEDIKNKHRELILELHPDKHQNCSDKNTFEERVKEINLAYKIIMDYCIKHPISFKENNFKDIDEKKYMDEHFKKFYEGWV